MFLNSMFCLHWTSARRSHLLITLYLMTGAHWFLSRYNNRPIDPAYSLCVREATAVTEGKIQSVSCAVNMHTGWTLHWLTQWHTLPLFWLRLTPSCLTLQSTALSQRELGGWTEYRICTDLYTAMNIVRFLYLTQDLCYMYTQYTVHAGDQYTKRIQTTLCVFLILWHGIMCLLLTQKQISTCSFLYIQSSLP